MFLGQRGVSLSWRAHPRSESPGQRRPHGAAPRACPLTAARAEGRFSSGGTREAAGRGAAFSFSPAALFSPTPRRPPPPPRGEGPNPPPTRPGGAPAPPGEGWGQRTGGELLTRHSLRGREEGNCEPTERLGRRSSRRTVVVLRLPHRGPA